MNYPAHPAADLFPLLDSKRLQELADDVAANGLREPIALYDEQILDGRNRAKACEMVGAEPRYRRLSDLDPFAYVWSLNGERRDLDNNQRYLIWAEVIECSEAWQAEQRERHEAANRARSEAQAGVPKAEAVERVATHSGDTLRDHSAEQARKTSAAKAAASKTDRGAVERMDRLRRERPDLAEQVKRGDMKAAQALREMKRSQVAERVQALPDGVYRIIYADPPWKYGDERTGLSGYENSAAAGQYPTMSAAELSALDVQRLAHEDAVLFCWATFPLLPDALAVVAAWGFKYKTAMVWDKQRANVGNYHDARAELLLICTRGSCTPDTAERPRQVQSVPRGRHSEKPEHFRALIDAMYPHGPRVELFRRGPAPAGWVVWGNEAA